jgi:hypothetical protein
VTFDDESDQGLVIGDPFVRSSCGFAFDQRSFALDAPGVTGQGAVVSHHWVAGDGDRTEAQAPAAARTAVGKPMTRAISA